MYMPRWSQLPSLGRAPYYAVYRFLKRRDTVVVQDRGRRYFLWNGGPDLRPVGKREVGRLLLSGAILPLSDPQPLPGLYAHVRPVYCSVHRRLGFRPR